MNLPKSTMKRSAAMQSKVPPEHQQSRYCPPGEVNTFDQAILAPLPVKFKETPLFGIDTPEDATPHVSNINTLSVGDRS
jgi:hypothetical protein